MKRKDFEQPVIEKETIDALSYKLMDMNRKLKKVQKEQSEMLANISHDLRAPVTAIRSALDFLNSGKSLTEEDYHSVLKLIDRRTATLESLIQDMYYLFSIEDTSRELSMQAVDMVPFLEEYFYDALADTRYGKHSLELKIVEKTAGTVRIDLHKMVRVLDNLFTNAVKYSPVGTKIVLGAECTADRNKIIVSVSDQGIGIPKEALEHIFDRTYRVSSARTPGAAAGSGLGLSIVKAIVGRHGGNVRCESIVGMGSTFSFGLPLLERVDF